MKIMDMKKFLLVCAALAAMPAFSAEDKLTDSRDGKTYKTVKIGNQTWMAENLNYEGSNSFCYDNDDDNCTTFGRLYTFDGASKVCPEGWRLPSNRDFESVKVSDESLVGIAYAGFRNSKGKYELLGNRLDIWASDEVGAGKGSYWYYSSSKPNAIANNSYSKSGAMSVRCIKESSQGNVSRQTEEKQSNDGLLKDVRDGKTYKIVKIGDQTWMAENLNYEVANSVCYNNNSAYCERYGRLYTWEAAQNACPANWHLPSRQEYDTFIEFVKLKTVQIVTQKKLNAEPLRDGEEKYDKHIRSVRWEGFDSFGFNLRAGGRAGSNWRFFAGQGSYSYIWTSTFYGDGQGFMTSGTSRAIPFPMDQGMSVRCIKNN